MGTKVYGNSFTFENLPSKIRKGIDIDGCIDLDKSIREKNKETFLTNINGFRLV